MPAEDLHTIKTRRFEYLLGLESEERNERRGLEQRAAALIAALLLVFPVAAAVAKDANRHTTAGRIGLGLLLLALLSALWIARQVVRTLAPDGAVAAGEEEFASPVDRALKRGSLDDAATEQTAIVKATRMQNVDMVRSIRAATQYLPITLLVLLLSLCFVVYSSTAP